MLVRIKARHGAPTRASRGLAALIPAPRACRSAGVVGTLMLRANHAHRRDSACSALRMREHGGETSPKEFALSAVASLAPLTDARAAFCAAQLSHGTTRMRAGATPPSAPRGGPGSGPGAGVAPALAARNRERHASTGR